MSRSVLLSAVFVCVAAAAAARASEGGGVGDDPLERYRERVRQFGERTAEEGAALLRAAREEAEKYALVPASRRAAPTRVPGSTWINLGPASAAFEKNGVTYTKIDSGRIRRVLVHPSDPNIVYVATAGGGVWKTFNAAAPVDNSTGPSWRPITDSLGALAIGSIAMDPHAPDLLLLGLGDPFDSAMPGLVHSTDGGMTWSLPVMLQGTYPGSTVRWTATRVPHLEFDGQGTGVVLAATDVGLFRSTSGGMGNDWTLVDLSPTHERQSCWASAWIGPGTWVVSCEGTLWRSIDGGASFTSVLGGIPAAQRDRLGRLTVAAAASEAGAPNSARVYLLAGADTGDATLDVFRSDDGGRTWASLGVNADGAPSNPNNDQPDLDVLHGQAWYNQMIAVDPKNRERVVIGGNLAMVRTRDGGATWDVMTDWLPGSPLVVNAKLPYVHADWHAGTFSYAGDKLAFYGGTDGGIFRSFDLFAAAPGQATFEDRINRGIVTHLIYYLATDETDSSNSLVLGGFQDNGTRFRAAPSNPGDTASGPTTFDQIWGGDGIGVAMGRTAGRTPGAMGSMLVVTNPDSIQRSIDGGRNFSPMMSGLPVDAQGDVPGNFFMKVIADFGDAANHTFLTLVNGPAGAAGARVYRWIENGSQQNAWADVTGTIALRASGTAPIFPARLNGIAADPKHAGQYGAVSSCAAYRKAAGATTWNESVATPLCGLASIAFDPADVNTFWVASRSGASGGHVFMTANGGATWNVRSTGLPDVPAWVVKVDPNDAAAIYAGTELGLYRSIDRGLTWTRLGKGLPLVPVSDLSIALDSSAIRVSTYGRGFWELFPSAGAPTGVYGDGDFDGNGVIDGFDLVRFGTVLGLTNADAAYDARGNLTGATNGIDDADLTALIAKLGGRP